jgi:hypothetical protein
MQLMAKFGSAPQSGFTLGPQGGSGQTDTTDLEPAGGRGVAMQPYNDGPTGTPGVEPSEPDAMVTAQGAHSTRSFARTFDTSPSVAGPMGPMNPGHVHNVVSTEGQWARGELPDQGYSYTFALRRPKLMREPRTDLGSYWFARG